MRRFWHTSRNPCQKRPNLCPIRTPALTIDAARRPRRPYQGHGEKYAAAPGGTERSAALGRVRLKSRRDLTIRVLVLRHRRGRNELQVAIETGKLDTVGSDCGCQCVNDVLHRARNRSSSSTILPPERLDVRAQPLLSSGIAEGCRQAGAALIGGETAEMPGMYADGEF